MKRDADLLVRGLWLSSFCFLEITWKTQGEETLEPSLVSEDKLGRNCLNLVAPIFKQAPFSPTPELISCLKALQTLCSANSFIPNKAP